MCDNLYKPLTDIPTIFDLVYDSESLASMTFQKELEIKSYSTMVSRYINFSI